MTISITPEPKNSPITITNVSKPDLIQGARFDSGKFDISKFDIASDTYTTLTKTSKPSAITITNENKN